MKVINFVMIACFFICYACDKDESVLPENIIDKGEFENSNLMKKYIYYAEWDEWGRAARDCDGWGLCNFYDCWGCDPPSASGGVIVLDEVLQEFNLTIELSLADPLQMQAISSNLPLIVDQDLVDEALPSEYATITIRAGSYQFDPEVGNSGGYIIPVWPSK